MLNKISNDTVALFSYLSLARSTHDRYAEMKTYRQLGLYHQNNYDYLKAAQYHIFYLDRAEKEGGPLLEIEALNTLAYDYKEMCALDESSGYYFKALSLLDKLPEGNNKKVLSERSKTLNGLGNIYLKINQPDEAISYLQKSLQIDTRNGDIQGEAKNLADIGSSFECRMEYDSAYHYLDRSLKLYIEENSVSGMSSGFERIGNLYMTTDDYESASVYIESAYNSLQHTSDRLNWLNCCLSLGNICIKKGDYNRAAFFLDEGLKVSEELGLPNYRERASMLLSELYKRRGNNAAALEAYARSVSFGKIFRSEQNISRITSHRLAYEKISNEAEKTLLAAQLENIERKKTKAISAVILIVAALTGFIIILWRRYRLRKRKIESSLYREKMKSDFYINISHEFKTPVTIITGLIERLRDNPEANDLHKNSNDLDILCRQSQDLLLLIDGISSAAEIHKWEEPGIIYPAAAHSTVTYRGEPENNIETDYLTSKEKPVALIVENNKEMVCYLSSVLEENYRIFIVDNGKKAFLKAVETMPDIIIANIIIPGMNGYDLCKEIKNSDAIAHIPVVLLSAYGSTEERVKGFRCGADAFLSKPVFEEELLAVTDQILDARELMKSKYAPTTIHTGKNREYDIIRNDASVEFLKQITGLIYRKILRKEESLPS